MIAMSNSRRKDQRLRQGE